MTIYQSFRHFFERITSDSVSCGTLALWAVAVGLLVILMQFYSHQLL
jgi:hypothetical protein